MKTRDSWSPLNMEQQANTERVTMITTFRRQHVQDECTQLSAWTTHSRPALARRPLQPTVPEGKAQTWICSLHFISVSLEFCKWISWPEDRSISKSHCAGCLASELLGDQPWDFCTEPVKEKKNRSISYTSDTLKESSLNMVSSLKKCPVLGWPKEQRLKPCGFL